MNNKSIEISEDGRIVYKGVYLDITRENIIDYQFQTGMDPTEWIEHLYNNSVSVKRDETLKKIFKKDV